MVRNKVGDAHLCCILKANLKLKSNLSEFCRLIASLSVILPQFNLIQPKLE